MDLRKLKTLIDLVSDSNVTELEITEAEGKVRIVKGGAAMVQGYSQPIYQQMQAAPASAPEHLQAVSDQSCPKRGQSALGQDRLLDIFLYSLPPGYICLSKPRDRCAARSCGTPGWRRRRASGEPR